MLIKSFYRLSYPIVFFKETTAINNITSREVLFQTTISYIIIISTMPKLDQMQQITIIVKGNNKLLWIYDHIIWKIPHTENSVSDVSVCLLFWTNEGNSAIGIGPRTSSGFTWATGFSGVGAVSTRSQGIDADLVQCTCWLVCSWSTGKCTLADDILGPREMPVSSLSRTLSDCRM